MQFSLSDVSNRQLRGALVRCAEVTPAGDFIGQAFSMDIESRALFLKLAEEKRIRQKETNLDYVVWEVAVGANREWVTAVPGDVILFNSRSHPGEPFVMPAIAADMFLVVNKV